MRTVQIGGTAHFKFTTRNSSGAPTQLAGTPVVDVYEDDSLTQITAGETLTVDFDSVTGLNHLAVACTEANGYEHGKTYHAVITTGTVGGTSVVGEVVAEWAMESAADHALRKFREMMYPDNEIATVTGNTTTAINLTEVVDASATADDLINEILAVGYVGGTYDGMVQLVVVTDYAVTNQLATVEKLGDGTALDEAVAASDFVWRIGTAAINNLTTAARADVNAEVDTALTDIHLDHLLAADYDPASKPGTATALLNELVESDGGVSRFTSNALEAVATAFGWIYGSTSGTPTTITSDTDLSGYANDELIGRTIIFKGGTADGQSARITDYANTNGVVTFTTLTTAPAASDTFIII